MGKGQSSDRQVALEVVFMKEQLQKHINKLFKHAPKTDSARDLKDELLGNLFEKYDDLTSSGKTKEEAFKLAVDSLGDVSSLIEDLKREGTENGDETKKRAVLLSLAVALYIASPVFVIGFTVIGNYVPGVILLLVCIAAATALLIYRASVYPKNKSYSKAEIIEDAEKIKKSRKFSSIFWLMVTVIYFVFSFVTGMWHVSWLIFLIGLIIEKIIKTAKTK